MTEELQEDVKQVETSSIPSYAANNNDLINTVDQDFPKSDVQDINATPEKVENIEDQKEQGKDQEKPKYPRNAEGRIRQLNDRYKAEKESAEKNLERALAAETKLKEVSDSSSKAQSRKFDYNDIMALSNDDIRDQFDNDPKNFLSNMARQIAQETYIELQKELQERDKKMEQQTTEQKIQKSLDKYVEDNPDFLDFIDSGEIDSFIKKNPAYDKISAYQTLTFEKKLEEIKAQAAKEAEEKVLKNIKVKGGAKTLSGVAPTYGSQSNTLSPQMKNSKAFGGKAKVITDRLLARMKNKGG